MRDYNFFESYQKKRNVSIDVKSPVFLGVIVILLILVVSAYLQVQNFILAAKLASDLNELTELQSSTEYQEAVKLQDSVAALTEYDQNTAMALERINEGKILGTELLKKLSGVIPSNVTIDTISLTRMTASITATVPNQSAAAELVRNLDQSGLFLQTTLNTVNVSSENGSYSASISCILKAGDQ